jgi:hypothetical protein
LRQSNRNGQSDATQNQAERVTENVHFCHWFYLWIAFLVGVVLSPWLHWVVSLIRRRPRES